MEKIAIGKRKCRAAQKITLFTVSNHKGQSLLLTHAILISFAIFLIFAVFTGLSTLKTDFEDFVADKEIQQACLLVKGAVEKIYIPTGYRPPENATAGSIVLQMPDRLAGSPYRVSFVNTSILVDGGAAFNTTCKTGFNLSFSGSASGGLVQIKYARYSNGTDAVEMTNA